MVRALLVLNCLCLRAPSPKPTGTSECSPVGARAAKSARAQQTRYFIKTIITVRHENERTRLSLWSCDHVGSCTGHVFMPADLRNTRTTPRTRFCVRVIRYGGNARNEERVARAHIPPARLLRFDMPELLALRTCAPGEWPSNLDEDAGALNFTIAAAWRVAVAWRGVWREVKAWPLAWRSDARPIVVGHSARAVELFLLPVQLLLPCLASRAVYHVTAPRKSIRCHSLLPISE